MPRFTVIQASDFNLLGRFDAGENIEPILAQRSEVGFNFLRVWTAINNPSIGRIIPAERPELYSRIPEFLQKCANHNLYVEITAFTGPYDTGSNGCNLPTDDAKVAHWESIIAACQGSTNVYLELVNEAFNSPNLGIPFGRLRRPQGILASHGSNIQDEQPVTPYWGLATYRPALDVQWARKVGHNSMEWGASGNIPIIANETTRCADNDSNPYHFEDAAAGATLLCAGACFHAQNGKNSILWDGQQLICAKAWVRGAKSVPLDYQLGTYAHRSDLENNTIIRAYSKTVPGLGEFIVRIRA